MISITNKFLFLFLFVILQSILVLATTLTSTSSGNWGSSSTWTPSRVPNNNDTVVVSVGKTVTVNINSPTYTNMVLKVYGTLFFNNGQKLNFDCASIVSIYNTGKLDGGNPGSKIDMCGSTVWRGPGPDTGPLLYGFNPLPINLANFSVNECGEKVCINWSTLTETNNDYFTIDKTKDDITYELVATIKGAGNSSSLKQYHLIDEHPYDGTSYYRLKQTDFNGAFEYFNLREVERIRSIEFSLNVFPNPSSVGDANLSIESEKGAEILVVVYDITGRETYSKVVVVEKNGSNILALDPAGKLKKGIYFVTGTSDRKVESKNLIIY